MLNIVQTLAILLGLLACMQLGRWFGKRWRDTVASGGTAAVDSVVFAVLGLLVAFTFTAAAGRYDERRRLIIDQANAVGTAWLRVDLLPQADRPAVQARVKRWLHCALEGPRLGMADPRGKAAIDEATRLQDEIWRLVIASYERDPRPAVATQLVPALNEWFDLTTLRLETWRMRMPGLVMATLLGLAFAAALLVGYEMTNKPRQSWLHTILFSGTIAFSIFVIIDLSDPRMGLITIEGSDQVLVDMLRSYEAATSQPSPGSDQPMNISPQK